MADTDYIEDDEQTGGQILHEDYDVIEEDWPARGIYMAKIRGKQSGKIYEHRFNRSTAADFYIELIPDNPWRDKPALSEPKGPFVKEE